MPRADRLGSLLLLSASGALALASPAVASAGEKKAPTTGSYIDLPTLTASILRPEGGRGVLTVGAGLDVADPKLRERTILSKPRLLDAYSQTLRRYGASLPPGRAPDLDIMGRQLQDATDRTLGKPGARFLFGAVLVN